MGYKDNQVGPDSRFGAKFNKEFNFAEWTIISPFSDAVSPNHHANGRVLLTSYFLSRA